MKFEDFRQVVADIINVEKSSITEDANLREDLGIDSLQMVNLIVEITDKFQLDLERVASFEQIKTVGSIYNTLILK